MIRGLVIAAALPLAGWALAGEGLRLEGGGEAVSLDDANAARFQTRFESDCGCEASIRESAPHGIAAGAISGVVDYGHAELGLEFKLGNTGLGEREVVNRRLRMSLPGERHFGALELGAFAIIQSVGRPDIDVVSFTCAGRNGRLVLRLDAELASAENPYRGPYDETETRHLTGTLDVEVHPFGNPECPS